MWDFFNKRRTLICLIILLMASFGLYSSQIGSNKNSAIIETIFVKIIAPVNRCVVKTIRSIRDFFRNYIFLVRVQEMNQDLKKKIQKLEWELNQYREMAKANDRYKRLLNFHHKIDYPSVMAEVIFCDSSNWASSIFVNRGRKDGVEVNMPVVSSRGVVGQTVRVTGSYSEIQILLDSAAGISALLQRTREEGIVTGGSSQNKCEIRYVRQDADIQLGDKVVTSGLEGIFPKGLMIGTVKYLHFVKGDLFKDVIVQTAVDFSKLEEVLIIIKPPLVLMDGRLQEGNRSEFESGEPSEP